MKKKNAIYNNFMKSVLLQYSTLTEMMVSYPLMSSDYKHLIQYLRRTWFVNSSPEPGGFTAVQIVVMTGIRRLYFFYCN